MEWNDFIRKLFDPSTPWITRSMYKAIAGISILFFFTVIIVKLVYDRCQAARNIENDNRSDDSNDNNQAVTEVIQDDNSEEITNR